MLNAVEAFDKAFDVSKASGVTHFFELSDFGTRGASSPISREEEREYWMEHQKESGWQKPATAMSNRQVSMRLRVQEIVVVLKARRLGNWRIN
jgi:hypothetical protein